MSPLSAQNRSLVPESIQQEQYAAKRRLLGLDDGRRANQTAPARTPVITPAVQSILSGLSAQQRRNARQTRFAGE